MTNEFSFMKSGCLFRHVAEWIGPSGVARLVWSLHVLAVLVLVLTPVACDAQEDASGQDERYFIGVGESNRSYDLHIPSDMGDGPVPLLIALHGAGDSGPNFKQGAGLVSEADRRGFLVAYPTASGVNWAEGCNCVRPDLDGIDDVGFLDAVIADIGSRHVIDPDRVYALGYSQGGLFAQHLACERSEKYAGIATISGMMSLPVSQSCQPSGSPDLFLLHGEEDPVLPFEGVPSGAYATLGVLETFHFWRGVYDCPFGTQTTSVETSGVMREIRTSPECRDGSRLRVDAMKGVGHAWAPFTASEVADFFGL